jgi:hypothetical protein
MGQLGLPSGTLGFVCSAITVVCCSSMLESDVDIPVYSDANAQDVEAAPSPRRGTRLTHVASNATANNRMSQLSLFDTDLRFHGLDVHSALEAAVDGDSQREGPNAAARLLTMRRITRIPLNAAVPEEDAGNEDGASGGGHRQRRAQRRDDEGDDPIKTRCLDAS